MLAFLMLSKRWGVVVIGIAGVIALSGCAPQSVANGTTELPPGLQDYPAGGEPAAWHEPDRLIVVAGGSSSCPTVFTSIERSDATVTLTATRQGGPICTTDLMVTPYYFELEGGRPDTVIVRSGDDETRLDVVDAED